MVVKCGCSIRGLSSAAIRRVGLLLVAITCVTGCAQLPLASSPGSTRAPKDADNLASFRDLLSGHGAVSADPHQSQSDVARVQAPKTERSENAQSVIYDGDGGRGQHISVIRDNTPDSECKPGIF